MAQQLLTSEDERRYYRCSEGETVTWTSCPHHWGWKERTSVQCQNCHLYVLCTNHTITCTSHCDSSKLWNV